MARRGKKRRSTVKVKANMREHVMLGETREERSFMSDARMFSFMSGKAIRKRVQSDFALTSGNGRGDLASIQKREAYRDSMRFIARHNAHVAAIAAGIREPIDYVCPHAETDWATITIVQPHERLPMVFDHAHSPAGMRLANAVTTFRKLDGWRRQARIGQQLIG